MENPTFCQKCQKEYNLNIQLPKTLQCDHIICLSCAKSQYVKQKQVTCSICKQITEIDPEKLNVNPIVAQFLSMTTQQSVVIGVQKFCTDHSQNAILYCYECLTLICNICAQYGKHSSHKISDLTIARAELKQGAYRESKEKIEFLKEVIENKLQFYTELEKKLDDQMKDFTNYIAAETQKLISLLEQRKGSKLFDFNNVIQKEITKVHEFVDLLKRQQKYIKSFRQPNEDEILQIIQFLEDTKSIAFEEIIGDIQNDISVDYESKTHNVEFQISSLFNFNIKRQEVKNKVIYPDENQGGSNVQNQKHRGNLQQMAQSIIKGKGQEGVEVVNISGTVKKLKQHSQHIYKIIKYDSNEVLEFNFQSKQFATTKLNIQRIDGATSFVQQIDSKFVITGGFNQESQKRMTLVNDSQNQVNSETLFPHYCHQTVTSMNQRQLFVLSGVNQKKCEVFDLGKNKQSKDIADILQALRLFGTTCIENKIYTFGGYREGGYNPVDQIMYYSIHNNL